MATEKLCSQMVRLPEGEKVMCRRRAAWTSLPPRGSRSVGSDFCLTCFDTWKQALDREGEDDWTNIRLPEGRTHG